MSVAAQPLNSNNSNDLALELYAKLHEVSGWFVRHVESKNLEELRGFNPSFAQIAKLAESTAAIITQLLNVGVWDDDRVIANAHQAATLMHQAAQAIENGDDNSIKDAARRLGMMDFI
ncbi:hypothetical protein [Pantoea agglomerans]|uniref:hypothetical protein n=1 Tax=Enterobacter agglomerans TaxID=549 RepID=UPI002B1D42D3|nr:hypothetical protein [Pantoea agglomerans]